MPEKKIKSSSRQSRRLRRFFSSQPLPAQGQVLILPESETHHLKRTLRLGVGDHCLVTDGSGSEAEACVESFDDDKAHLQIEEISQKKSGQLILKVYFPLVQHGKMDDWIEKAQELGVQEMVPLETERSVIKMKQAVLPRVLERWRRIVQQAAKQSGSLVLIEISSPRNLQSVLNSLSAGDRIAIFHPDRQALAFRQWIQTLDKSGSVHLFFGPEGGFSPKEVAMAQSKGGQIISLGDNILRAETAVLGVLSSLRFLFP